MLFIRRETPLSLRSALILTPHFFVSTGLFDNSAHSSSVAAVFNSFRGKNGKLVIVQAGHRVPGKINADGLRFLKINIKVTEK